MRQVATRCFLIPPFTCPRSLVLSCSKEHLFSFITLIGYSFIPFLGMVPALASQSGRVVQMTPDGAWCWFQGPRAVHITGKHDRAYAQWVTSEGKLQVGSYGHNSKTVVVETIKESWDPDDHNVGAFVVLNDHRLMLFYARPFMETCFFDFC